MKFKYTQMIADPNGWASAGKFMEIARENGVSVEIGDRENATDGEVHYLLDGKHEVHANYWQAHSKSWDDALRFTLDEAAAFAAEAAKQVTEIEAEEV